MNFLSTFMCFTLSWTYTEMMVYILYVRLKYGCSVSKHHLP